MSLAVWGCGNGAGASHASGTGGSVNGGAGNAVNGGAGNSVNGRAGNSVGGGAGGTGQIANAGPSVDAFVGLDGFIDDPVARLTAIGNVREYHNWTWNDGNDAVGYRGYPASQLAFSLWGGFWDFDAYYAKLHQAGVMAFPAIQGSVGYLGNALPPVPKGDDPTNPQSYVAHASFMYQYAARYGGTKVPTANLLLASGQTVVSGLGVLDYFEDGNEPDNNWTLPAGAPLFTPESYAAMASADYDGDRGALGATFGVKAADPGAKLVMAGLAGAGRTGDWVTDTKSYLDGIVAWAKAHRGGSFPADVINVHYYCFGASQFSDTDPVPALSPEACKIKQVLAQIVAYRDEFLPGKELWLTEFGYDTHPKSRLRAPAIGSASAEVVQGQWLVRSFLELMGSGIDRAFLFVSRDACTGDDTKCPNNHIQFSTSGVLTQAGQETPKPAFFYIATLRSRLGAMRYVGTADSGASNVSIAKFSDPKAARGAYVVWSPSSTGSSVAGYSLAVSSAVKAATIVSLVDGSSSGTEAAGLLSGAHVRVDVSETPTLVLVDAAP